jgi:hypothetical protein
MSFQLIRQYHTKVAKIIQYSGSHNESAPGDPTVRAKFNAYRFLDYKETVIDLLQRVRTVSVETMQIIGEMKA